MSWPYRGPFLRFEPNDKVEMMASARLKPRTNTARVREGTKRPAGLGAAIPELPLAARLGATFGNTLIFGKVATRPGAANGAGATARLARETRACVGSQARNGNRPLSVPSGRTPKGFSGERRGWW